MGWGKGWWKEKEKKKKKNKRHASGSLASCSSCRFHPRRPGGGISPPPSFSPLPVPPIHPPHAHIPPTSCGSPACKGVVGRSWGGGGVLRVSNLVLINKPTCAAAAAATHPTIPDISPAPLRRKKASPACSHPTHPQGPLSPEILENSCPLAKSPQVWKEFVLKHSSSLISQMG